MTDPTWLVELQLPHGIRRALADDARTHGWTTSLSQPEVCLLGGRARDVLTAVVFASPLLAEPQEPVHGYVMKRPHRDLETNASLRASELSLGPRVVYADEELIIEEYFPSEWLIRKSQHVGERLAHRFADMFVKMISNNFFHGFDDIPAHLYVAVAAVGPDLRFIDWARAKALPQSARDKKLFLVSKLAQICELVRQSAGGVPGYQLFRKVLRERDAPGFSLGLLLLETENHLITENPSSLSSRVGAERWRQFLKACSSL